MKKTGFDKWVYRIFDHPVKENAWYWDSSIENPNPSPSVAIGLLTKLFNEPEEHLKAFSNEQINQGLWYIADNSCSNYMFVLTDESLITEDRLSLIESIYNLFKNLFARRCSPHLSYIDEKGANPLNSVCYMWWDLLPICGQPDYPNRSKIDQKILNVMQRTLELPSIACQESALHGLGHWETHYPKQVETIINNFLEKM